MEMLLILLLPIAVTSLVLSSVGTVIVWGARGVFGLRAGLIAGRIMLVMLILIPIAIVVGCSLEMSVPPAFEGDQMVDNDAAVRMFFFGGLIIIPAVMISLIVVWLWAQSFARSLKLASNSSTQALN